jgi:hypothetical protein
MNTSKSKYQVGDLVVAHAITPGGVLSKALEPYYLGPVGEIIYLFKADNTYDYTVCFEGDRKAHFKHEELTLVFSI